MAPTVEYRQLFTDRGVLLYTKPVFHRIGLVRRGASENISSITSSCVVTSVGILPHHSRIGWSVQKEDNAKPKHAYQDLMYMKVYIIQEELSRTSEIETASIYVDVVQGP